MRDEYRVKSTATPYQMIVWRGALVGANKVQTLKAGDLVWVIGTSGNFYQLESPKGYIVQAALELVNVSPPPVDPPPTITKKIIKAVVTFDDNSTVTLYPTA